MNEYTLDTLREHEQRAEDEHKLMLVAMASGDAEAANVHRIAWSRHVRAARALHARLMEQQAVRV